MLFKHKPNSLRKSKTLLLHIVHLYKKKKQKLSKETQAKIENGCKALEEAILKKERALAHTKALELQEICLTPLKKGFLQKTCDLIFALAFALSVAVIIRQMWFELYEIPSGSMRPTLKEKDRLIVSKTDLGINIPLTPKHFYFDPNLVLRNNIVIFSGEGMDIPNVDTLYFYLFPGKKQYVKRLIGKPGDILYFYGGEIYGLDREGNEISKTLQNAKIGFLEHIPFIHFMSKTSVSLSANPHTYPSLILYQMNEPIAKLSISSHHHVHGQMLPLTGIHEPSAPPVQHYSDLWGMGHFGMTRLLTATQVKFFTDQDVATLEEAPLYLEIRHHPSLETAKLTHDEFGRPSPVLGLETSLIPLQEHHLRALFKALYTARFEVDNGFAFRFGTHPQLSKQNIFLPHLSQVPNGTYEFDQGKVYEVGFQGILHALPQTHPLCQFDISRMQLLYNLGIEWDTRYSPQSKYQRLQPSRYTYFKEGNLYLMGVPILKKEDPTLEAFVEQEKQRAVSTTSYVPFIDKGPPLKEDGSLDTDFVRHYGLQIPEGMYFVLGDNHAMSGDSREFGFVPAGNLRGGPSFIFWPPGSRFGIPNQVGYPWLTLPTVVIWTLGLGILWGSYALWKRRGRLPLKWD